MSNMQLIRLSTQFCTRWRSLSCLQKRSISVLTNNQRNSRNNHNVSVKSTVGFSTSCRRCLQDDGIVRSPLGDVQIPESPFMPHYLMEHWHKYTDKLATVNSTTGATMTYGQFQSQIVRVGSALVKQGYSKDDVITIFSPNVPEFCVMYMAAASIGMTVSAVNPVYTADELIHAMNLSDCKLLAFPPSQVEVVNAALPKCKTVKKTIIFGSSSGNHQPLDSLLDDDGKDFPENIEYSSKEDVLLLPYSSGTTGLPKGVMLTSYNLIANMQQYSTPPLLNPRDDDIFICELPLFHMFAQTANLLMSFRYGITNVLVEKFNPIDYLELVKKYRPTWLHLVPPIMLFLAKHPVVEKYDFSCVRNYLYAAAPMAPNIITEVQHRIMPNADPVQAYGLTELSPVSHLSPSYNRKPETAGVAVHNTEYKVFVEMTIGAMTRILQFGPVTLR